MKTPKYALVVPVVALAAIAFTGCTEDAPSAAELDLTTTATVSSATAATTSPIVLSTEAACAGEVCQRSGKKKPAPGEFASPLFGLATAPNNDILVADAGAGIALATNGGARLEISLPGVTSLAPIGRGAMWATTGAGGDPETDTGQALYRVSQGKSRMIVNLYAYEATNLPDGGTVPDSNPYDVASLGGNAALVVDAGGNDLLRVDNTGRVELLALFPPELASTANVKALVGCPNPADICSLPDMIPTEAVPTSVAVGPDGYYYVGELKGFPAPTGVSRVWRVSPNATGAMCGASPDCELVLNGFTSIIDLAFDAAGVLHVAELDEASWFAVEALGAPSTDAGTINACDVQTATCSEVATGIPILTAITFGKGGSLWATQNALVPGLAAVVQVD